MNTHMITNIFVLLKLLMLIETLVSIFTGMWV